MDHFLRYISDPEHSQDDSPLYIFDGTFADPSRASAPMAADYSPPGLFSEDLFHLAGEKRRPPYRWVVIGPARSGTGLHVDPLATNAWNALLAGHKRWALFPPGTHKQTVLPREPGLGREAICWFTRVFPRTQAPGWPTARPVTCIQRPGETMFVPHGWLHAVLNLDLTIAVTHNYCGTANFEAVWRHARRGRPKLSARWLAALGGARRDLAAVAGAIDASGDAGCATSSSSSDSSSSSSSSSSSDGSSSESSSDGEAEADGGAAAGGGGGGGGREGGGGQRPGAKRRREEAAKAAAGGGGERGTGTGDEREAKR
ncbi:MAG: hypothetical protein J3K34DRAFT_453134 [Monoraphidium minutum]|nr:MAG: hypothetical protein J3K34DRAFT_453134 [Monoraphidium minutum]